MRFIYLARFQYESFRLTGSKNHRFLRFFLPLPFLCSFSPFHFVPTRPRLGRFAGNESHNFGRNSRKKFPSHDTCKSREEKYLSTRLVDTCRHGVAERVREKKRGRRGKNKAPLSVASLYISRLISRVACKAGSETNFFFLKSPIRGLPVLPFLSAIFFLFCKGDETIGRSIGRTGGLNRRESFRSGEGRMIRAWMAAFRALIPR